MNENEKLAMKVSYNTLAGNIALSGLKLAAGIFANSGAMVSDAVHSASDVFSTIIVMVGIKTANKESDKNHPYGHERFECVAAIILSAILFATGAGIGYSGMKAIFAGGLDILPVPGALALGAAVVSIVAKEGMYWYTKAAANKIDSGALMADAWHHRSDALSSVGSFIGILGSRIGYPVMDPIASVVICLFIIKAAYGIFMDAINKMTDMSCDDTIESHMREIILSEKGVLGIDELMTRRFGDRIYVDIEISADGNATLFESHDIAQRVHDKIESQFPKVKHCMVHVNPKIEHEQ